MFEQKDLMFLYCVSPVHMGAGTALGAIDSPIQRERHTQHPMMAGSGLKGALRAELSAKRESGEPLWDEAKINDIFGPETNEADDHAGALSFSDAQIVLFPVRSLRQSYVYATCPTAIERLRRLAISAGHDDPFPGWIAPELGSDQVVVLSDDVKSGDKLILEVFDFELASSEGFDAVASWLAEHSVAKGRGLEYFGKKMAKHTVLMSDDRFAYFARNATVVEPHVRIDDDTGAASKGGLFYVENLPPESLLASLVMASNVRRKDATMKAGQVVYCVREDLGGRLVQVGGNATTGRGQVVLRFASQEAQS